MKVCVYKRAAATTRIIRLLLLLLRNFGRVTGRPDTFRVFSKAIATFTAALSFLDRKGKQIAQLMEKERECCRRHNGKCLTIN